MSPIETPKASPGASLGARLDTALGRFTMYRLVLLVLAVLAVYSLVLDALGWLTFGIPEMLAHLVLCLGLTYASNRALAPLFSASRRTVPQSTENSSRNTVSPCRSPPTRRGA